MRNKCGNWYEEKGKARGRYRIEICPDNKRDAVTLIPLVIKRVKPGTTIVTDLWKSYFGLTSKGFTHFTVNHSADFIYPITSANTHSIESSWRCVKRALKTGLSSDYLADHLAEFWYRRQVKISGEDPYDAFLMP